MYLLLLKTTKNSMTSLNFVGASESRAQLVHEIDREFGELKPAGFGSYRMLGARGEAPVEVEETKEWQGSSYVLATF